MDTHSPIHIASPLCIHMPPRPSQRPSREATPVGERRSSRSATQVNDTVVNDERIFYAEIVEEPGDGAAAVPHELSKRRSSSRRETPAPSPDSMPVGTRRPRREKTGVASTLLPDVPEDAQQEIEEAADAAAAETTLSIDDVKKLTVAEIKAALNERGLPSHGLKHVLVQRLIESLRTQVQERDEEESEEAQEAVVAIEVDGDEGEEVTRGLEGEDTQPEAVEAPAAANGGPPREGRQTGPPAAKRTGQPSPPAQQRPPRRCGCWVFGRWRHRKKFNGLSR